jgi:hypothetical protein
MGLSKEQEVVKIRLINSIRYLMSDSFKKSFKEIKYIYLLAKVETIFQQKPSEGVYW